MRRSSLRPLAIAVGLGLAAAAPARAQSTYQYARPTPNVPWGPWTYSPQWRGGGWSRPAAPRTYSSYYYPPATTYRRGWGGVFGRRRWGTSAGEYYWPTGRDVPVAKPWLTP
jgi:hypothetical protein